MSKAWVVALMLLGPVWCAVEAGGELPLPTTAQDIVQALRWRDGRTTFRGQEYELSQGQLFEIRAGKRRLLRDPTVMELPPAFVPRVGVRMQCDSQTGQLLPTSHAVLHAFGQAFAELATAVFAFRVAADHPGAEMANSQLTGCVQAVIQWLIVQHGIAEVRLRLPAPAAEPPGTARGRPTGGPRAILVECLRRQ